MQYSSNRVLIYSHDTFGLGHLRRCSAIAQELISKQKDLSVLIISGSLIFKQFTFDQKIEIVSIPSIKKLTSGKYRSHKTASSLTETIKRRSEIIQRTACRFMPTLFIVDKEPLGLKGEIRGTLEKLKSLGVPCVLGLRDILDDPKKLSIEWKQKNAVIALERLYSEIWVYGVPQVYKPLSKLRLPKSIKEKLIYTGYLRRNTPPKMERMSRLENIKKSIGNKFILATPGGGGDGAKFVDAILGAYEKDNSIPYPALIVLGPLMPRKQQKTFMCRAKRISGVTTLSFDPHIEIMMKAAVAVVAMGGYNTFCEILSFNKPALLLPRSAPRQEQLIRAKAAQKLGLVSMVDIQENYDTNSMILALKRLPQQPLPNTRLIPGLLDGLTNLNSHAEKLLKITSSFRSEPFIADPKN